MRALHRACVAALALGCCVGAWSQDFGAKPRGTALGIAIGKPTYGTSCGNISGLTCSNNGTSVSVTAADMITRNWGAEVSYLDLGKADRAGGTVSARGVNLSIVGRAPLTSAFDIEGKVGTTWGITHVDADPASGLANGRESGFGIGYGAAVNLHLSNGLATSIGWEQHEFHFVGQGTSAVKNLTVGMSYHF